MSVSLSAWCTPAQRKAILIDVLEGSTCDIGAGAALVRRFENDILDRAAALHESINVACDHERPNTPGAGAMAAVIEYRDAIRALKAGA